MCPYRPMATRLVQWHCYDMIQERHLIQKRRSLYIFENDAVALTAYHLTGPCRFGYLDLMGVMLLVLSTVLECHKLQQASLLAQYSLGCSVRTLAFFRSKRLACLYFIFVIAILAYLQLGQPMVPLVASRNGHFPRIADFVTTEARDWSYGIFV